MAVFLAAKFTVPLSLRMQNRRKGVKNLAESTTGVSTLPHPSSLQENDDIQVENITRNWICIATHGRKDCHLALGCVAHKNIVGNRPALPQTFKLLSPPREHGTFYEHRDGRWGSLRGYRHSEDVSGETLISSMKQNVLDIIRRNPSICAAAVGESGSSFHSVLQREDLHPYHLQRVLSLHPQAYSAPVRFARWYLDQFHKEGHFPSYVLHVSSLQLRFEHLL
ncbi:hypothetical protein TNCV_2422251 [Trichonephila clavipes]|nr:hypothetical protein TNCV_2422251 [Trichonephila clavipes]